MDSEQFRTYIPQKVKLKHCPMCGANANLRKVEYTDETRFWNWEIRCEQCQLKIERHATEIYGSKTYSESDMEKLWNARIDEAANALMRIADHFEKEEERWGRMYVSLD